MFEREASLLKDLYINIYCKKPLSYMNDQMHVFQTDKSRFVLCWFKAILSTQNPQTVKHQEGIYKPWDTISV